MEFGTWYQINCETDREWHDDFALIRDSGFNFVVLWNMLPTGARRAGDVREIVYQSDKTLAVLAEIEKSGLAAYLGIWHPYHMGSIPAPYRPRWSDGRSVRGPNIFNEEWLHEQWVPYVRTAAKRYARHDAYRGVYVDDTFPVLPQNTTSYLSYAASDKKRFRAWLKRRYLSIQNLNMKHKLRGGYRSFSAVDPPRRPAEALALWTDWVDARSDWCEGFARLTMEAYRSVDKNPEHHVVLSDQDYHMQCNPLQYGVDYARLMRHFDRFEIYMAADHRNVGRRALLANAVRNVQRGRRIAGGKPFQFHTWFADPVEFKPMRRGLLEAVLQCAADNGADTIEIYTFKVCDWRVRSGRRKPAGGLPPFREVSLKYAPKVLARVRQVIGDLR